MKRSKKSLTKIKLLILLMLLTVAFSITATYAWFSTQREVEITGIKLNVEVAESMQISLDGAKWYQSITIDNMRQFYGTYSDTSTHQADEDDNTNYVPTELKPVSTIGEVSSGKMQFMTGDAEMTGTTTSVKVTACSEEDVVKTATVDEREEGNDSHPYLVFDMYLRNYSAKESDYLQLNAGSMVWVDGITATTQEGTGQEGTGLENCIRVGFVVYENTAKTTDSAATIRGLTSSGSNAQVAIWEPNSLEHIQEVINNSGRGVQAGATMPTYGIKYSTTDVTISNVEATSGDNIAQQITMKPTYSTSEGTLLATNMTDTTNTKIDLEGNAVTKIRVYIWIEGQDVDCINTASQGDRVQATIKLTKPENSDELENTYINEDESTGDAYALILDNSSDASNAVPMIFVKSEEEISVGDTYNSSTYGELEVTAVYTGFETAEYNVDKNKYIQEGILQGTFPQWIENSENITSVIVENKISPINTVVWFLNFKNCSYMNLKKIETDLVTDMTGMFGYVGNNVTTLEIEGISNWDVSSVTDMSGMFESVGANATSWSIGDLSSWDVSSVTDMSGMFDDACRVATSWSIGDLSSWDVSSVTNMFSMFSVAGERATTWSVGDLSNWDVSSVTDMSYMFCSAGYNSTTWSVGDLSNWDVSSVTDMSYMFSCAGHSVTTWSVGDLSNWDVSSVTDMSYMFQSAGYRATTWSVGDLSNWDVSSVTDMKAMFQYAGYSATTWSVGDLSNWDVSAVTDMSSMFYDAGYSATYYLDLSGWAVTNVTDHTDFNYGVSSKVIAPTWNE